MHAFNIKTKASVEPQTQSDDKHESSLPLDKQGKMMLSFFVAQTGNDLKCLKSGLTPIKVENMDFFLS